MLNFPLWKKLLVTIVCLAGLTVAFPNLFYGNVERHNDALLVVEQGGETTAGVEEDIGLWPSFLPSGLVNLGLDLRGGAHVLVEVRTSDVYAERMESLWPELRDRLREERDTVGSVRRLDSPPDVMRIRIGNPDAMNAALEAAHEISQPVISLTGATSRDFTVSADGDELVVALSDAERSAIDERTMLQSLEIIRRRVDETGTREPTIQRQGSDRILVQVPGIGSAEELLAVIGQTAKLSFHPVVNRTSDGNTRPGLDELVYPSMDEPDTWYILEKRSVVTGEQLVDSQPSFDQNGLPSVSFRFNAAGGAAFGAYTAENIGSPFAIVLDGEVISAPVIQSHIPGGSGIITGNFTPEEASRLSILLRAGALPAEIDVLEQRTIGPELGQDSIDAGKIAALVAMGAVLVFMALAYGLFGIIADIALLLNIALIFALLTSIGATLTLPGIAGLVLTIGMAVDANVLIFERIREELKGSRGPARAIELGYEKAFSAILDANVTTLIAAVILFVIGSGPVRGFSVTLGLGIVTSVFTALYVTRMMIVTWYEWRRPKTISV
ncbi:protein translocase subunit SecD [Amaricoccus tamworthensis]|uniref:protein translocase subunit SecD n=1 Tax=Amaricoccus tamworthensis TaxID=57002 RepID=UPI003C7D8DC5